MTRLVLAVQSGPTLYGIPSEVVREITPLATLTRLPGASAAVRGLQNVRGALVTVVDLAMAMDGAHAAATDGHVVLVEVEGRVLGLLVSEVHEVYEAPQEGEAAGPPQGFVARVGHFGEAIVIEVNVPELVRLTLV